MASSKSGSLFVAGGIEGFDRCCGAHRIDEQHCACIHTQVKECKCDRSRILRVLACTIMQVLCEYIRVKRRRQNMGAGRGRRGATDASVQQCHGPNGGAQRLPADRWGLHPTRVRVLVSRLCLAVWVNLSLQVLVKPTPVCSSTLTYHVIQRAHDPLHQRPLRPSPPPTFLNSSSPPAVSSLMPPEAPRFAATSIKVDL
jgi:hypothetical protein